MIQYYAVFFKNMNPLYFFADAIEIAEGVDYSHVEIVKVTDGDWSTADSYGSVFKKSRKIPLAKILKGYQVKYVVPLRTNIENPEAVLNSLMGKPYSFVQISIIAVKLVLKSLYVMLPYTKVNMTKNLICTELAGIFMQEACGYRFETSPEVLSVEETRLIAISNLPRNEV